MKKYAKRSEAKKKNIKFKRGPKKLNFRARKPGVRGARAPRAPLDPLVESCHCPRVIHVSLYI